MTSTLVPILVLLAVVAADLWVYADAKRQDRHGSPVVARLGTFVIEQPTTWLIACIVLFVIFFPMYLVSRTR